MKLVCDGWSNEGMISVLIIGKTTSNYEYRVDAARIPDWRKRMKFQPGRVLNEIRSNATDCKRIG